MITTIKYEEVVEVKTIKTEKHQREVHIETVEYHTIDASFIEELAKAYLTDICDHWGVDGFSVIACYERGNDCFVTENIKASNLAEEMKDFNASYNKITGTNIQNGETYGSPRLILTILAERGIIPEGEYLIDIGW